MRLFSVLTAALVISVLNSPSIGAELPPKDGGLYTVTPYFGWKEIELGEFDLVPVTSKKELVVSGKRVAEVSHYEVLGQREGKGTVWTIYFKDAPIDGPGKSGQDFEVDVAWTSPGKLAGIKIRGVKDVAPLEREFSSLFRTFETNDTKFAVGDKYYSPTTQYDGGAYAVNFATDSVVDGITKINGRTALAVRFATSGRLVSLRDDIKIEVTGYGYIDLLTSVALRRVAATKMTGIDSNEPLSLTGYEETTTELPNLSTLQ